MVKLYAFEKAQAGIEVANRLKDLRSLARLTQKELSQLANVSESTIQCWEYGRAGGLTEKGASKIITALRQLNIACSIGWLLTGLGIPPQKESDIVIACKQATELNQFTLQEELAINKEIELFCTLHQHPIVININDNAMLPYYKQGDRVGGIQLFDQAISQLINKICIIKLKDGTITLRWLQPGTTPNHYNLHSNNPESSTTLENVEIESAAAVMRAWYL